MQGWAMCALRGDVAGGLAWAAGGVMEVRGMSAEDRARVEAVWGMLSPRQREVAALIMQGYGIRRVADALGMGDSTARNLMRWVRVGGRACRLRCMCR